MQKYTLVILALCLTACTGGEVTEQNSTSSINEPAPSSISPSSVNNVSSGVSSDLSSGNNSSGNNSSDNSSSSKNASSQASSFANLSSTSSASSLPIAQPETFMVPARIQAQSYSQFGEEDNTRNGATQGPCATGLVDLNTTTDNDGECTVGFTRTGEWLEYEIVANSDALYDVIFRAASLDAGKQVVLSIDGVDVGNFDGPAQGWDKYSDEIVRGVNITTGNHTVRITFMEGGVNLNYFEFKEAAESSSSSFQSSSIAQSSSSTANTAVDPKGFEGPLFGGLTENERKNFYFQEQNNTVVVEGEHFISQSYGNDAYRGARWWMVQSKNFNPKDHPSFASRCALAKKELEELDTKKEYGGTMLKDIVAFGWGSNQLNTYWGPGKPAVPKGREPSKGIGGEAVFKKWGCDADNSHAQTASNGQAIELLPDVLNENYNEIPHGASNWKDGKKAPKAYYKVKLSGGSYTIYIRGYRTEGDSGSVHVGHTKQIGKNETTTTSKAGKGVGFTDNKKWSWKSHNLGNISAGTQYIIIAGREDGFEVDKIVVTKGTCGNCKGTNMGPAESKKIN